MSLIQQQMRMYNKIHVLSPLLPHVSALIVPSSGRTFLRTLKAIVTFCDRLATFIQLLKKHVSLIVELKMLKALCKTL
jgi:hypothetical protein